MGELYPPHEHRSKDPLIRILQHPLLISEPQPFGAAQLRLLRLVI
jgi:hypothetical protein